MTSADVTQKRKTRPYDSPAEGGNMKRRLSTTLLLCGLVTAYAVPVASTPVAAARAAGVQPFARFVAPIPQPGQPVSPQTLKMYRSEFGTLERYGLIKLVTADGKTILQLGPAWPGPRPDSGSTWNKYPQIRVGTFRPDGRKFEVVGTSTAAYTLVRVSGTFMYDPWVKPSKLLVAQSIRQLDSGTMNYIVQKSGGGWKFKRIEAPNIP